MSFLSDSTQTLTAAFSFGILLQSATGGVFIYYKGHRSTILKDGRRLVLLAFLGCAALWAQTDFVTLLLPKSSPNVCQGVLIVSTLLDQLSRVALEQFLLWSISKGTKVSLVAFILQGVWLVRLVAGGVLVGFSRPEFAPTCVARTSLLPASIAVLALDVIIIGFLIVRAISLGMFSDLRDKKSGLKKQRSKALLLTVAGFLAWTGTSVAMILGVPGLPLILRTVVPANGLIILVGIVTLLAHSLLSTGEPDVTTPEAQSPFVGPEPTSRDLPGGIVGSSGPMSANKYAKNGRLFVVNETVQQSPSNYQSNPQRSTRGFSRLDDDAPQFGMPEQGRSTPVRGPGYRGSSGVFGNIVGAPMIGYGQSARNLPVPPPSSREAVEAAVVKRSLFGWSSKPPVQTPVRALGISGPIMASGSEARVATIDLATAARNERERREAVAVVPPRLLTRPLPPQPSASPNEELNKSIGLTRKEIPSSANDRLANVPSFTSTRLLPMQGGSSTATSLSPGHDEVRRRSPRNMSSFDIKSDEKPMVPAKLQRPTTMGLPSNPRSQKPGMSKQTEVQNDATIMRVNNIVYANPGIVRTVIQDAESSYLALQRPKTADQASEDSFIAALKSPNSMIHRPRPYRKDSEGERGIFPAEAISGHSRSKSAGSALTTRSSMFSHSAGSPTSLPALPPLPRTASELKKLLPNDTKSMTFDEKIQLLFPAPPRSAMLSNRRSSVPSVPRVPSMFVPETPKTKHSTNDQSSRTSKRTTIASFAMLADSSFDASSPIRPATGSEKRPASSTSQIIFDDADTMSDENLTFGNPRSEMSVASSHEIVGMLSPALNLDLPLVFKRPHQQSEQQESPERVVASRSIKQTSTDGSDDGTSTDWESIHSRTPIVDLREARKNARSTFIRGLVREEQGSALKDTSTQEIELSDGVDTVRAVEDGSDIDYFENSNSDNSELLSIRFEKEAVPTTDSAASLPKIGIWHHRIGDQLPTFSERQWQTRVRKMPPPTPLLLNRMGRSTAHILVHAAEPSPIESPERAIEEIKAQLARLEEKDQNSFDFVSQHKDNRQMQVQDRLRLLENLEKEMYEQEDQWQQLNQDRNSSSTTLSITPSNASFSRNSSRRGSKRISQVSTRNERIKILQPNGDEASFTTSSQSSDNSRASIWQTRLAEAQLAYLANAPALLRKSLNFLAMPNMQIASPTPPESEESCTDIETELGSESESDSDVEFIAVAQQVQRKVPAAKLWEYALSSPQAAVGRLWSHPYVTVSRASIWEPPARNLQPLQHHRFPPLELTSTALWTKPSLSTNPRVTQGLWGSKVVRPKSILTKRASGKPIRKSRRLTVLPDIVESPVPVPYKRDTLGIFQFPWGETSDQPIYQPAFVAVPFSNFTTNSKLNARSMELEPENAEYSSSFFDDYDDEEEGDEEANYESSEDDISEDEFDDTTLLEIADLLKSDEVPSRKSLFSPGDIVEDYASDTEFDSTSDVDISTIGISKTPLRLPIPPLSYPQMGREWPGEDIVKSESPVEKTEMWTPQESRVDLPNTHLFSVIHKPSDTRDSNSLTPNSLLAASVQLMWSPLPKTVETVNHGLFNLASQAATYRTTTLEPAALDVTRKPRVYQSPLPSLGSTTLWNGIRMPPLDHHWINESCVSPPRAPMYSSSLSSGRTPSSSGSSSFDVSDATSISTASTSVSSLWASMSTTTPTWWEPRSLKDTSPSLPMPDFKKSAPSTLDVRASRHADLNSKIPKLRRKKSTEAGEKFQDARAAATSREPKAEKQGMEFLSIRNSLRPAPRALPTKAKQAKEKLAYQRIRSSEEDWNTALAEAVALGTKLNESAMTVGPSSLWSASSKIPASGPTKLWSKTLVSGSALPSQIFNVSIPKTRRALPAENPEYATIKSTELWKSSEAVSNQVNWLSSQSITLPKTWRPRKASAPVPLTRLWSAPAPDPSLESPKTLFAHNKSAPLKKSTPYKPATLQELNSTELFEPISEVERPLRTHWLWRTTLPAWDRRIFRER